MNKYTYTGPVLVFGNCLEDNARYMTMAASEKKALSNIAFQAKKHLNLIPGSKVELPGKLICE